MAMTSSKKVRTLLGSVPSKEGGVRGDAEAALDGLLDAFDGDVPTAFTANGEVVVVALAIEMHGKGEVLEA